MVDKFEVGKYYRWIKKDGGETAKICPWPTEQEVIGKMMDGVPRRCASYDGKSGVNCGGHVVTWERFESKFNLWHPSDFDLVPEPPEGWRYLANGERYAPGNKVFTGSCFKDVEITSGVYESWNTSPVIVPITSVSQHEIVEYWGEKWRELGPDEPGANGDMIALPEEGIDTSVSLAPCNYGKTPKGFERRMWRKVKDTPKDPSVLGETKDKKEEKKMPIEDRQCATCEYRDKLAAEYPCNAGCAFTRGRPQWTPRGVIKEKPSLKSESEIWAKVLGSIKS